MIRLKNDTNERSRDILHIHAPTTPDRLGRPVPLLSKFMPITAKRCQEGQAPVNELAQGLDSQRLSQTRISILRASLGVY